MFSRVTRRPDLEGLNLTIFPQGPYPGQIIEITGDEATGKTLLATDLLARCLLPKTYKETRLPGKDCGALFINTNHHFDVFKLAEVLQHYIRSSCRSLKSDAIQGIIKESLKNLTVINCYTNEQFQATLLNLESIVLQETNISLLIVDTVAAFYWIQRIHSSVSYSAHYSLIINSLKNLASKFGITVFYTKPNVAVKETTKKHTDFKIQLKKSEGDGFEMEIVNYLDGNNMCIRYNIEKTFKFQN